jgi:hypothetical protein
MSELASESMGTVREADASDGRSRAREMSGARMSEPRAGLLTELA